MFAMTLEQWRSAIAQLFIGRGREKIRTKPTRREKTTYFLFEGDAVLECADSLTKSEARAEFKRRLNVPRLPITMRVLTKPERLREVERALRSASGVPGADWPRR